MSTRIGRVAIKPLGAWTSGTTYNALDLVTHNGKGYISKVDGNTIEPTATATDYWMLTLNALAVDTEMSDTSDNPVANNVIKAYVDGKKIDVDTEMSDSSTNAVQNNVIKAYVDGQKVTVDTSMSDSSENPVQNKAVKAALDALETKIDNIIDGNEVSY